MVKWLRKSSVAASGLVPDGCLRLGLCKAAIEKKWGGFGDTREKYPVGVNVSLISVSRVLFREGERYSMVPLPNRRLRTLEEGRIRGVLILVVE